MHVHVHKPTHARTHLEEQQTPHVAYDALRDGLAPIIPALEPEQTRKDGHKHHLPHTLDGQRGKAAGA